MLLSITFLSKYSLKDTSQGFCSLICKHTEVIFYVAEKEKEMSMIYIILVHFKNSKICFK